MGNNDETPGTPLATQALAISSSHLQRRIDDFRKEAQHIKLDPEIKVIQFLRGAWARASYILPAYYNHLGAQTTESDKDATSDERVHAAYARFSSLATISLACRSVFDDRVGGLTGKTFATAASSTIVTVAAKWVQLAGCTTSDALKALEFLQNVFKQCAHQPKELLKRSSLLERRIGLLEYHADHEAAHISLGTYMFHLLDIIHVAAAMTVIGAIIVEFDAKKTGSRYFDAIDESAWRTAKATFPKLPGKRLFENFSIHQQARLYWKSDHIDGLDMILNGLPAAIGYWG
jgi:hypothetical protein